MRRIPILLLAAVAAIASAPAAHAARPDWNADQRREVAAAGVLGRLGDGRFHGERPLTGAQLGAALGRPIARRPAARCASRSPSSACPTWRWMIHSSSQGVYVSSLDDGRRRGRFTWARRIV